MNYVKTDLHISETFRYFHRHKLRKLYKLLKYLPCVSFYIHVKIQISKFSLCIKSFLFDFFPVQFKNFPVA